MDSSQATHTVTPEERPRSDVREALPLGPRARVAVALLGLVILVDVVTIATDLERLSLVNQVLDGERVPFGDLDASDDRVAAAGIAQLVTYLITGIAFLLWYSRAYRNAIAMGIRKPRYGTRWAVAYWFIPLANLVLPKKVMNDIYRGSDPEMTYGDPGFAQRPVHPLLHWWWALWILAVILSRVAASAIGDATTPEDFAFASKAYVVSDLTDMVAAILAILVVRKITARAEERRPHFETLAASSDSRDVSTGPAGGPSSDPAAT